MAAPSSSAKGFDFVLHHLCRNEDWGEVRSCLKVVPSAAKVPLQGDLPLHVALAKGCPRDVAEALVAAHPEGVNAANSRNQYPLLLAITAAGGGAYYDDLESLITPESVRGKNVFGESALAAAVSKELPLSLISALLFANPDAAREKDEMDNLPLHEAVEKGNEDVIKLLYDAFPEAAKIENGMGEIVEGFWS